MTPLQKAAQALVNRWDLPTWKNQSPTADYISELRKALDAEISQSVEHVGCGYDETTGNCTKNPCCNLSTTSAAPEGYALVPVEPTDEELAKGVRAMRLFVTKNSLIDFSLGYKAMLAAAQGENP